MASDPLSPFPLESISDAQLQMLGQVLWGWELCGGCSGQPACTSVRCPWYRAKRLGRFWSYYKEITGSYVPELLTENSPALRTHEDLFDILRLLKAQPDAPRSQLTREYFSRRLNDDEKCTPPSDQNRAFNLAVRVMIMVNCSVQHQSFKILEHGEQSVPWQSDISISRFIAEAFPRTDHPYLNEEGSSKTPDIKSALAAKKLKKQARLRFEATDDIRNHLKLNRKQGTVQIFHHSAVLKENLLASQYAHKTAKISDFIRVGNIPRQLAFEALDSIHKILFPPDLESQSLLSSLVTRSSFDEDCLRFESASYRTDDEKDINFHYFGSRLADLYDELEDPTPRGWLQKWLERKSGARYVMMATLVGVIIAVVLGMLGLAVGIFQAWIAYQQWKHPISNS